MIRNFGIVKNSLVLLVFADPVVFLNLLGKTGVVVLLFEQFHGLFDRVHIVLRQGLGIGTRVGQDFVFFVQSLRQAQGVFRRETKARIGLALQTGQIKQRRCHLRRWFGLLAHVA